MHFFLYSSLLLSALAFTNANGGTSDCPLSKRDSICLLVSQDCVLTAQGKALARDEVLRNPPASLLLVEKTASTLAAEWEAKRNAFRVLLQNKTAHVGDARFVTVLTPKGLKWQGQVMDYVERDGKIKPSILFRSGSEYSYDPEVYSIYSSSESLAGWQKSRADFEKHLSAKNLNGIHSFILYPCKSNRIPNCE